jgi:hypothetical protein
MLDMTSTNSVASPMASAFLAVFDTASTGHMPRACTKTGFSFQIPLTNSSVPLGGWSCMDMD